MDRNHILNVAQQTFGRTDITRDELNYILMMLNPHLYLMQFHSVRNGTQPMTFNVKNRDINQIYFHRPWQMKMIDDQHPNKAVMKSRQLGLVT